MTYAYIRVSTLEQNNGPEAQRMAIIGQSRYKVDEWVEDKASGKSLKRPGITDLLGKIKRGDTLIVAKLDRMSRSVIDAGMLMRRAIDEGWNIVALDLGVDLSTPSGKLVATVVIAMAEFERELIGQRTKDALAVVKLNGSKSGRPIGAPRTIKPEVCDRVMALREDGKSLRAIASEVGIIPASVRRILARAS